MKPISKITAVVNKSAFHPLVQALAQAGIRDVHYAAGRTSVLEERRGVAALFRADMALGTEPADVLSFFVDPAIEAEALSLVAHAARLQIPGMGSVFSEPFMLAKAYEGCQETRQLATSVPAVEMFEDLAGICCIVQRGQGDALARVALEAGAVPVTTYGDGTGLRDKLGLLRITIPAEKEVSVLVVGARDADSVLEMLIEAGRLDLPGKGFIYRFPVNRGWVDTRISRGATAHAATIEQIITAIDALKGSMEWRESRLERASSSRRNYFEGTDLSLICDEGWADRLVEAAMEAGAAGATIEKLRLLGDHSKDGVSPARALCSMVVASDRLEAIVSAMDRAGGFDEKAAGMVFNNPVPKAFTYVPK